MIPAKIQIIEFKHVNLFSLRRGPAGKRGPQNAGISLLFAENKRDRKTTWPETATTPINVTKISTYASDANIFMKIKGKIVEMVGWSLSRLIDPSAEEKFSFRWHDDPMVRWPDRPIPLTVNLF